MVWACILNIFGIWYNNIPSIDPQPGSGTLARVSVPCTQTLPLPLYDGGCF